MNFKNTPARVLMLIAVFGISLQACKPAKPGIYKTDLIPSGTRDKLHGFNDQLLSALKTNTTDELEQLMSQDMIADQHNRLVLCEHISNDMKNNDYSLLSDYYIVNPIGMKTGTNIIHERDNGINNFDLTFNRGAHEMYIALFTPKKTAQQQMITAVYYKLDYGWKIMKLEINPYTENGMTAPELVKKAKEMQQKEYWLDASNTASFAVNCLRPYSDWQYVGEDSLYKFNTKALVDVEAHCKLPSVLMQIPTHPDIWRIKIERNKEGAFPNINYVSSINLLDTVALKKENVAVGKAIGTLLKGVDKDKKYIYYTIYNRNKLGIPVQDHYDITQKL